MAASFRVLFCWLLIFVSCKSYLSDIEKNVLYDFYYGMNGDKWTRCKWNITMIMNQTIDHKMPRYYCGLTIIPSTESSNSLQTVHRIFFNFDNNLDPTIPKSTNNLIDIVELRIFYNPLITGNIPQEICNLKYLYAFSITNTDLYGHLPIWHD